MKVIKETDLPGIGRKFHYIARSGDKVVVIVHDDGRREIYHYYTEDPGESISMITLDDEEARWLASIVGGLAYRPKALETVDVALGDVSIEWYKIEPGTFAVGQTIGELRIRQLTGGSVIAIIEADQSKSINPGPDAVIHEGATLVILGEKHQVNAYRKLLTQGCEDPNSCSI